jgi:hypothetical protein
MSPRCGRTDPEQPSPENLPPPEYSRLYSRNIRGVVAVAVAVLLLLLLLLSELLFLVDLPPLAEAFGGAAGDLGGDLLPLVAVLGLEGDDEGLFLRGEGALLQARLQVVLPALQAGLGVALEGLPHALGEEVPLFGAILLHVGSEECVFLWLPPLTLLHFNTIVCAFEMVRIIGDPSLSLSLSVSRP